MIKSSVKSLTYTKAYLLYSDYINIRDIKTMTTPQSSIRNTPSELNSYIVVCQTVSGMVFSTRVMAKNKVDAQHQMYDDLRVANVLKVM